jgi:hypothetical protein
VDRTLKAKRAQLARMLQVQLMDVLPSAQLIIIKAGVDR